MSKHLALGHPKGLSCAAMESWPARQTMPVYGLNKAIHLRRYQEEHYCHPDAPALFFEFGRTSKGLISTNFRRVAAHYSRNTRFDGYTCNAAGISDLSLNMLNSVCPAPGHGALVACRIGFVHRHALRFARDFAARAFGHRRQGEFPRRIPVVVVRAWLDAQLEFLDEEQA